MNKTVLVIQFFILLLLLGFGTRAVAFETVSVLANDPGGIQYRVCLTLGIPDKTGVRRNGCVWIETLTGDVVWKNFSPDLHPWMLDSGTLRGQSVVLVGVYKTAVYDPVERKRPFIYTLRKNGLGLRKFWLGTSLARPFTALRFANLNGLANDELVALEITSSGKQSLGAYYWKGFGFQGIAVSEEFENASGIDVVDINNDGVEEIKVIENH